MPQHFLPSAKARTLSLRAIYKAGEEAAYDTFRKMRWPETDGEAICPRCEGCDAYDISTRRKFKCRACHHQFSVTSGTIFASRKMDFVDLLAAICILVNASKGVSAVQLSRDIDCQYKTAFVLSQAPSYCPRGICSRCAFTQDTAQGLRNPRASRCVSDQTRSFHRRTWEQPSLPAFSCSTPSGMRRGRA